MSDYSSLFWQLVDVEHRKARAYCCHLAGNADDGDDLYQDSVVSAYRGFAELRKVELFRPWFYRIINNGYYGRRRSPWWRRVLPGVVDLDSYAWSSDPSGEYDAKRRLNYALAALSAEDRIIVTLAELEGWKLLEVAELMSKSEGFVKMRLSRARKKMRKRLSSLHRKAVSKTYLGETENICCVTKPDED